MTGFPGFGFEVWSCPVDGCPWAMTSLDFDRIDREARESFAVPAPSGSSGGPGDLVDRFVRGVVLARAAGIERAIRAHLESHDLLDFVRTIARLRSDLYQRESGVRSHARRHDADALLDVQERLRADIERDARGGETW